MPGTTEPSHLHAGVFVATDGLYWVQADNIVTPVALATAEAIDYNIDDTGELTYDIGDRIGLTAPGAQ